MHTFELGKSLSQFLLRLLKLSVLLCQFVLRLVHSSLHRDLISRQLSVLLAKGRLLFRELEDLGDHV